jgi:hypothetical protein
MRTFIARSDRLSFALIALCTIAVPIQPNGILSGGQANAGEPGNSADATPAAFETQQAETLGISILPEKVTVSADYPARFVVTLLRSDGTQRDITDDPELQLHIEDNGIARLDAATLSVAKRAGQTRLRAAFAGFNADAAVHVTDVGRRVPAFAIEVSAVLSKSGCNLGTCHGNLHGKSGFRLSLRGDDPAFDFASITRAAGGRRINLFEAEQSLLLRKPSGQLAHQGGLRLPADSPGFEVIQRWLTGGSEWDASAPTSLGQPAVVHTAPTSRVVKLDIYPSEAWLYPEDRQQRLVVVAELSDGSRRDVTRWARYEPSIPAGVIVGEDGKVASERPIDVSVAVSFLDARAQARIVFLEPAPSERNLKTHSDAVANAPIGRHRIDEIIQQRLKRLRLEPTEVIAPELFLRRLFLVVAGRLPSIDEVQQFLNDSQPDRQQRWIERAMFDDGYAYLWALRWSDLLRNEPKVMSLEGAGRWNDWLSARFAEDMPADQLVRELVQTVGSTFESPPASFHRTHREPDVAAEALGQIFLGVRIQCARCHNHPFDVWKQDDYYGLAAYFTTVERKQIDNAPRDRLDTHIISGDEIISVAKRPARIHHPGRSRDVAPKPLDQPNWSEDDAEDVRAKSNQKVGIDEADEPLAKLADWLTTDNRAFARNMANRIWYHVMGRGIVDPPDDFRVSNPPSNPELLEYLTDRLIESGYSTRTLMREIVSSEAFSRQSVSQESNSDTLDASAVFAGYPLRRLSAEVLLDAISDVTGVMTPLESEGKVGALGRAVRHPGMPRDGFLRAFGKPDRLLSCECERSTDASLSQSLLLINGADIRQKISASPNRLDSLMIDSAEPMELVRAMYLAVLTRLPQDEEAIVMVDYLVDASDLRGAAEDVLWALLNSQEFSWIR